MGLGDKFKDLAKQAQKTVAEHKEQIHDAVDAASVAADQKTRGKYTAKIAKMGQKAGEAVDKVSGGEGRSAGGEARSAGGEPDPPGSANS
jgi:MT0933-like antitoxin protein